MLGVYTGLDFRGDYLNPSASPSARMVFNATVSGTAPFAAYPATYIWRVFPRFQPAGAQGTSRFWTFLFWAPYVTTFGGGQYYGFHPIPVYDAPAGICWEIAANLNSGIPGDWTAHPDMIETQNGWSRWYTQVARVHSVGDTDFQTYYWDWPDKSTSNPVRVLTNSDTPAQTAPADPAIVIGDAPWNIGQEIPSAIIRGLQFYDAELSEADVQKEIDKPGSARTPWYINLNPTPDDISDKSGAGHNPAWADSGRPDLWVGSSLGPVASQQRV